MWRWTLYNTYCQDGEKQRPRILQMSPASGSTISFSMFSNNLMNSTVFYIGEHSCGFFQWCDEAGKDISRVSTAASSGNFASSGNPGAGNCYKCGLGGHWAKDCSSQGAGGVGNNSAYTPGTRIGSGNFGGGLNPAGGRTCYKCGQGGHWVTDCPNEAGGGGGVGGGQAYNSARTPETKKTEPCYKCGRQGHWASSCPNSGGGVSSVPRQSTGSGPQTGGSSCYKCGEVGHWSSKCPRASGGFR
ncbi:hypothetical protein Mp_5g04210 [Marchantia polymorpha subsp. ruderalis]|uniref:CCHC-type domain-containing protein n=2 Tax=Marchantia polymorpha TaxID=3197 RepID=A0AAF6BEU0_MARPO|nr:hypothetical protein MARPO_0141s0028 [Marchantia polymorpha]BBN10524.1 hypothetical protein Mp_5g04210 [Marchantia polymorpha subsp. ruderalis]|eukprot:PTQ29451.1 hypothetical protein MARPO_0141s0028 [Marchantia polymorpha]